jgi:hypothetical protein
MVRKIEKFLEYLDNQSEFDVEMYRRKEFLLK